MSDKTDGEIVVDLIEKIAKRIHDGVGVTEDEVYVNCRLIRGGYTAHMDDYIVALCPSEGILRICIFEKQNDGRYIRKVGRAMQLIKFKYISEKIINEGEYERIVERGEKCSTSNKEDLKYIS